METRICFLLTMQAEWLPSGKKQDWKLFDERCQLQPLANGALSMSKKRKGGRIPILFIGDSTDNLIIRDICNLGRDIGSFGEPVGYKQDHGSLDVLQVIGPYAWIVCAVMQPVYASHTHTATCK